MKKEIFLIVSVIFIAQSGFSQTFDPAYSQKFGYGVILASQAGYPEFAKYNESQFNFKNNKFMFPVSEDATIDLRMILPQGTTIGSYMSKLLKEKPQNLGSKTAEYTVWSVWCWNGSGHSNPTDPTMWPTKKTDTPLWSEPCVDIFMNYDAASNSTWATAGLQWASDGGNLQWEMGSTLHAATPGDKFYITYRVAYEYSFEGGEAQQKWDSDLNKWVPSISQGGIGYVYSDPIAVGVVEIEAYVDPTGRFVDNGNGTVTDAIANLMWMKTPSDDDMYWDDAQLFAENSELAGYSDWRLPNLNELKEMMKISKIKDNPYECNWFNQNGFSNIKGKTYWCGDTYILNGSEHGKNNVDFQYKITGADEVNYLYGCWLVRDIK